MEYRYTCGQWNIDVHVVYVQRYIAMHNFILLSLLIMLSVEKEY